MVTDGIQGFVVNESVAPGVAVPEEFEAVVLNEYVVLQVSPVSGAENVVPSTVIVEGVIVPSAPADPANPTVVIPLPAEVRVPLSTADTAVIEVAGSVTTTGTTTKHGFVVNEIVTPGTAEPAEFKAVVLNE